MEEGQEVGHQGGTQTTDVVPEQPEAPSSSKPPSGLNSSGSNSPRIGAASSSSPDAKQQGLGPRHASSNNGEVSAAGSEAGLPPVHRQSSNLANRIAAFASGVAPVRRGITNADEDSITVEEVLHKLETAGRVNGADKCELPVPLIRSAHEHLVAARDEAARTSKELAELKASRVQHIPPSTWIKREQKYKMEVEKFEHTIGQLRARSDALEREVAVLREGSNVRPLEEKIQELEHQLVAAAEEKTKVQSKFHELSIKHRQLIETSPQVATIWNEVLVQQAADGHNAAAMQRLVNFDLRHTAASPGVSKPPGPVSAAQSPGVSAAAAIYGNGSGPVPVPATPEYSSISGKGPATEQPGPSTPMQQPDAAAGPGSEQQQQPQTAEERAHALMAAVALEGLSSEASLAALQQLNYDLTMQLGCYQQMVSRLKDAMESSDLEKAELEAEKMALEMQLAGGSGSATDRSSSRGWGAWTWRRSIGLSAGGPHPAGLDPDHDDTASLADGASIGGLHSLSSSRRSSMDLDSAAALASMHNGGSGSNAGTPTKAGLEAGAAADGGSGSAAQQQQQDPGKPSATSSGGGLFAARRQRAAERAAAAAGSLGKEVKELTRQVKSLQDENKYLVNNLVEIKMELAEAQGANDQAKRALVRAMDKESCLDMQVVELRHMLDISTRLNQQYEQQAGAGGSMAAAGAAAAAAAAGAVAAAAKAAVAAVSSTPNSAKAAIAAMQSPFGRVQPDQEPAADVAGTGVDAVDASAVAEALAAAAHTEPTEAAAAAAETQQPSSAAGIPQQPDHSHPEAVHSQPLQLSESSESFEDADDAEEGGGSSESTAAVKGAGGGGGSAADPVESSNS